MKNPTINHYKDGIEYRLKNKRVFLTNIEKNSKGVDSCIQISKRLITREEGERFITELNSPQCSYGNPENISAAVWLKPNSNFAILYFFQPISVETIHILATHTMLSGYKKETPNEGTVYLEMNLINKK